MSKTIKQTPPVKGHRRPGKLVKKITHHRERHAAVRMTDDEHSNYVADCMAGHARIYHPK
jgi:hypothetical protein